MTAPGTYETTTVTHLSVPGTDLATVPTLQGPGQNAVPYCGTCRPDAQSPAGTQHTTKRTLGTVTVQSPPVAHETVPATAQAPAGTLHTPARAHVPVPDGARAAPGTNRTQGPDAQASEGTLYEPPGTDVTGAPGALTPEVLPVPGDTTSHDVTWVPHHVQERYSLGTPCHVPGGPHPDLPVDTRYLRGRYPAASPAYLLPFPGTAERLQQSPQQTTGVQLDSVD